MNKRIYFDHNATTTPYSEVIAEVSQLLSNAANPSSVHFQGRNARSIIEESRRRVLAMLGFSVLDYKVLFTSGGTEANNTLITSYLDSEAVVLTSSAEHPSILEVVKPTYRLPVDQHGIIDLSKLIGAIEEVSPRPVVLSIALANGETGVIQPMDDIVKVVKNLKSDAIIHVDATQACGKIPLSLTNVDAVTISGHKFGGILGAGALVLKQSIKLSPLLIGGEQEFGMRAGTQNYPAIYALGVACANVHDRIHSHKAILDLRNKIESYLMSNERYGTEISILGSNSKRLPNTTAVAVAKYDAATHVARLDLAGIAVSAGSACSAGIHSRRHVPLAMGYSEDLANTVIRISLGIDNTISEVNYLLSCWREMGI